MSWLEGLNAISPDQSPQNGLNDPAFDLSFPIDSRALEQQLEAWTNVSFDFDSAVGAPIVSDQTLKDERDHLFKGRAEKALNPPSQPDSLPLAALDTSKLPLTLSQPEHPFTSFLDSGALNFPVFPGLPQIQPAPAPPQQPVTAAPTEVSVASRPALAKPSKGKTSAAAKKAVSGVAPSPPEAVPAEKSLPIEEEARGQDDVHRLAIEEDKRRRNTAASARFRVKKKQREQALEASAQALRDKVTELEKEVDALRTENGWLRGLIVEKSKGEDVQLDGRRGVKRAREDDGESAATDGKKD